MVTNPTQSGVKPGQKGPAKKPERPADPLALVHVHVHEAVLRMPVTEAGPGHNSEDDRAKAEELLDNAMRRLDQLDAEIAARNKAKGDVYRELASIGLDKATVAWLAKDVRLDPIVRANRDAKRAAYSDAIARRRAAPHDDQEENAA
jgi:uncharacterized protein (UPF0335 family)